MKIPWSLVGLVAVLLPLGAYAAGTMAGSTEPPDQRAPIIVNGSLSPGPDDGLNRDDPSEAPEPKKKQRPDKKKQSPPPPSTRPEVVRPHVDDDDDWDDDDDDDDDDDRDDDDDDD